LNEKSHKKKWLCFFLEFQLVGPVLREIFLHRFFFLVFFSSPFFFCFCPQSRFFSLDKKLFFDRFFLRASIPGSFEKMIKKKEERKKSTFASFFSKKEKKKIKMTKKKEK